MNKIISTIRSIWYTLTEPVKLKLARRGWVNKHNPLISVYIPTLDRPRLLLERGLKSVLNQTYKNIEVIIADDVLFTGNRPKNIKDNWLLGPTYAANAALKKCKGEWIARNDDDDIWTPDHLEKLLRFAQQNDFEYVSAAQEWVYSDRTEIKTWQDDTGEMAVFGGVQTSMFRSYLKFFKFNKHCWRKKWNANNDIEHPVRMYKAGVRMGFLNKIVTIVSPRPNETEIGFAAVLEKEK